ncbi:50S ribosomal protein L15e [Nanoarchaeota archaeon]
MGLYQHIREAWKKPKETLGSLYRERLIEWRRGPAIVRIKRPTRLDRARSLGYKAKQGFVIVRVRVKRGGHKRTRPRKVRRSKRMHIRKDLNMSYQWICEQRAVKPYPNCEVLNSYWVGKDGHHYFYEVILIDRVHPQIQANETLARIAAKKGRVQRGLTSAGRKSRGLRKKGKGAEKVRPSLRSHKRIAH